jgi:hypothetical protein
MPPVITPWWESRSSTPEGIAFPSANDREPVTVVSSPVACYARYSPMKIVLANSLTQAAAAAFTEATNRAKRETEAEA